MEKSEIFIANTRESDRPVQKRILDELREDISLFQEDLRPIIEKVFTLRTHQRII
jgi:hypothetical protein